MTPHKDTFAAGAAPAETAPAALWAYERASRLFNAEATVQASFKEGGLSDLLVSENSQNTQDGTPKDRVARLRFLFRTVPRQSLAELGFEDLVRRAAASGVDTSVVGERVRVLEVSDGGVGLNGEYRDALGDSPYQRFARRMGSSGKGGDSGGRWGMGRANNMAASVLKAIYGVTSRSEDGKILFFGLSEMRVHDLDGERFQPYGVFGVADDRDVVPPDADEAVRLGALLGCRRGADETGLSILIPALSPEVTPQSIVQAVIERQCAQIALGQIEFEVVDEDSGMRRHVNAATLPVEATAVGAGGADISLLVGLGFFGALASPAAVRVASLDAASFDPEELARLRADYADGRPVAVSFSQAVRHRRGGGDLVGEIKVVAVRDERLSLSYSYKARDGILVVSNPRATVRRATAVVASNSPVAVMLGDAENPSHSSWHARIAQERGWIAPKAVIDTFARAGEALVSLLSERADEKVDENLLSDLFAFPEDGQGGLGRRGQGVKKVGGAVDVLGVGDILVARSFVGPDGVPCVHGKLNKTGRSKYRRGVGKDDTRRMVVASGYQLLGGDGIKDYSITDFDLSTFRIEVVGAKSWTAKGNRIEFFGIDDTFEFKLFGGFDIRRELALKLVTRGR